MNHANLNETTQGVFVSLENNSSEPPHVPLSPDARAECERRKIELEVLLAECFTSLRGLGWLKALRLAGEETLELGRTLHRFKQNVDIDRHQRVPRIMLDDTLSQLKTFVETADALTRAAEVGKFMELVNLLDAQAWKLGRSEANLRVSAGNRRGGTTR